MKKTEKTAAGCSGGQYLDLSLLRPADVILTFPAGMPLEVWESIVIKLAVGGSYSHAILVLRPTLWYESEDRGVGPTMIGVDRIEIRDGNPHLLKCLDVWARCAVFRHPEVSKLSDAQLLSLLTPITDQLSYKEYPSFSRIAHDLEVLEYLPLRDSLLRLKDDKVPFDVNRGLFCSEVVGYVYRELKYPFAKRPEQTCPADIADFAFSGMERIYPFCPADSNAATLDATLFNVMSEQEFRRLFVGAITNLKTFTAAVTHVAQQARDAASKIGIPVERLTAEGFPLMFADVLTSISSLCSETNRLVTATAMALIPEETEIDRGKLEDGIAALGEPEELLADSADNLEDLTTTYLNVVKPDAHAHAQWQPLLSGHLRHSEENMGQHIAIATQVDAALRKALQKARDPIIKEAIARFIGQTQRILQGFEHLSKAMDECRGRIEE